MAVKLTVNEFEVQITALGTSSGRYRATKPGVPMASDAADAALNEAVDQFKETLEKYGFVVTRRGYGVRGTREVIDPE